jgi:hypothetical protein
MASNAKLCAICRGFDLCGLLEVAIPFLPTKRGELVRWHQPPPHFQYHIGWNSVFRESQLGCSLCSFVWGEYTGGEPAVDVHGNLIGLAPGSSEGGQLWIIPGEYPGQLIITNDQPQLLTVHGRGREGQAAYAAALRADWMRSPGEKRKMVTITADIFLLGGE